MIRSPKTYSTKQLIAGDEALYEYCVSSNASRTAFFISDNIADTHEIYNRLFSDIYGSRDFKIIAVIAREPNKAQLDGYRYSLSEFKPDEIIAIGGGSVMDTAKALCLFYELPHLCWEDAFRPYQVEKRKRTVNLVAVPTTSGTGSEMTGAAMVLDEEGRKQMILTNEIVPDLAILDYSFLKSLPPKVIVYSGVDAIVHALEAATDTITDPITQFYAIQSVVTLMNDLPKSLVGDLEARARVHVASSFAGFAINHGGCGLAHSLNTPGEIYHLPHGLITGMVFPLTLQYYPDSYALISILNQLGISFQKGQAGRRLSEVVWKLYESIGMPSSLKELGIDKADYLSHIDTLVQRFEDNDRSSSVACCVTSKSEIQSIFYNLFDQSNS